MSAKGKAPAARIACAGAAASESLGKPVKPEAVVGTYSGVRPLYDDGASEAKAATREYAFELDTPGGVPLLSALGSCARVMTNRVMREAVEAAIARLRVAERHARAEGESRVMPRLNVSRGAVGHAPPGPS